MSSTKPKTPNSIAQLHLKFLPPELTRDEEAKKRFIHEAQAASSLQHNNICTIHDVDETEDGQIFMCMDCYEGKHSKNILMIVNP